MITEESFKKVSMYGFIAILIILTFLILRPILLTIFFALVLGFSFLPVYNFFLRRIKSPNFSALLVVLMFLLIVILPLWFLLPIIIKQLFNAYVFLQGADISSLILSMFPNPSAEVISTVSTVTNTFIANIVGAFSKGFSDFIIDIPNFSFQLGVFLFVLFFVMRDSVKLFDYIKNISPFSVSAEKKLSDQFKGITNAVIYGQIIVGIIQGVLTGVGLFIFGAPNALLFTFLAILTGIIPIIGAWLIWVPISIYFLIQGDTFAGIGLILYGSIIISWIDNIIRPKFVADRSNLNTPITLVGMIGGLMAFGILGLIIGPLIISYLIIVIESYQSKVSLFSFTKKEKYK
ncbi:MAG: AI-2E family transporter [Nanoarchaeota archaeon]|nr:AI-2E family transporter [Nanoarchaeota archaeon]